MPWGDPGCGHRPRVADRRVWVVADRGHRRLPRRTGCPAVRSLPQRPSRARPAVRRSCLRAGGRLRARRVAPDARPHRRPGVVPAPGRNRPAGPERARHLRRRHRAPSARPLRRRLVSVSENRHHRGTTTDEARHEDTARRRPRGCTSTGHGATDVGCAPNFCPRCSAATTGATHWPVTAPANQ